MKNKTTFLLIFLILGYGTVTHAQDKGRVGIKTTNPKATLDVNGKVKVREVPEDNASTLALTIGNNNIISKTNIPRFFTFSRMEIPICDSSETDGSFTVLGSDGNSYAITWEILSKTTGSGTKTIEVDSDTEKFAEYPVKPERMQVKYTFNPELPYTPDGFGLTAYNPNVSGSDTTSFSLNYTTVSQSSITVNITRTDISSGEEDGACWNGQYYFDIIMFKYQSE